MPTAFKDMLDRAAAARRGFDDKYRNGARIRELETELHEKDLELLKLHERVVGLQDFIDRMMELRCEECRQRMRSEAAQHTESKE